MGCTKLDILDEQYKRTEQRESYRKKELTPNFCNGNARRYLLFGTTSYRSGRNETEVSLKRYKYNGKERDEETGLYMYGMRYYAAWLCRWTATDPLQFKYSFESPYCYCANNPIKFVDPDGKDGRIIYNETETRASIVFESTIHVYGKGAEEAVANANAKFAELNNKSTVEIDGKIFDVELKITWQLLEGLDGRDVENMSEKEFSTLPGYVRGDNFLRVGVPEGGGKIGYLGGALRGGHWGYVYATSGEAVIHESLHNVGLGDTGFARDIMNNRILGEEINQRHFVGMVNLAEWKMSQVQQKIWENQNLNYEWNLQHFGQDPDNPQKFNFTYRNPISH